VLTLITERTGSWFVLERWIADTPFAQAASPGQSDLDVAKGSHAKEILERHWDTWITRQDFEWLAARGINAVRIPVRCPAIWVYSPLDHAYRLGIITYAALIVHYCQGRISMVLTVYLRVLGSDSCEQSRPLSSMASVFYSVCESLLPFYFPNSTYRLALCSREAESRFSLGDFISHGSIHQSIQSRAYCPSPSHFAVCRAVTALGP
jgi:hypothetical protein